jgi:tetratricopeptide (TPR) repeat protein
MKKIFKIIVLTIILINPLYAKNQYLHEGINLFKNKKFKEAKFAFEKDIVFNPKSELGYLYLSKVFKKLDNKDLQEQNLNTVILLNPNNEEATYDLAKLKLDSSDFEKSKKLNDTLSTFCENFCEKSKKLKIEIENLSKK